MVHIDECSPAPAPELELVPAHPDPSSISPDSWRRLEGATLSVVQKIQPTVSSEHLRAAVIDYVQRLFRFHAGCQVFPFGSVPLKTYLPDGDIDLTAFNPVISDENLANEVCAILKSEEKRKDAEFEVKDIQYINAEVKLVKCLVQNIVIDISFNQIGGLCTLCFLEKVDQNFGKNHLLKRSIMLIKDWCYYESHILGAHHGLISTYALETLVIYIFHIFYKSLDGPLAVLYRFLDYYSKFDWDNKGISLFGPISLSSLPELLTDPWDTHDDDFLRREEFLRECTEGFNVSEKNKQAFSQKFLNIVDPLKQSNNLGRSVSKGNFYRIRSAFDFGARKLGKILHTPPCSTFIEVNQFFRNTLQRNDTGLRPDVLASSSDDGLMTDHVNDDLMSSNLGAARVNKGSSPLYNNACGDLSYQCSNIKIDSNNQGSIKQKQCKSMAEYKGRMSVSGELLDSGATIHSTTDSANVRNGDDLCEALPTASKTCTFPSGTNCAPHHFYNSQNGRVAVRDDTNLSNHGVSVKQFTGRSHQSVEDVKNHNEFSGSSPPLLEHNVYSSAVLVNGLATNSVSTSENSQPGGATNDIVSDLTGDFDTNLHNLLYAQGCQQDNLANQFYYPMLAPPPPQYRNVRPSNVHGRKNPYGYAGTNGAVPGSPYPPGYFVLRPFYQTDDHTAMRARGTGTYFPDPNFRKDRLPAGHGERVRNNFPSNNYRKFHHHIKTDMPVDMIPVQEWCHELPAQMYIPSTNDHGMPSPTNVSMPSPSSQSSRDPLKVPAHSPSSHVRKENFHGNDFMLPQDSRLEFGTLGVLPSEVTAKDHTSRSGSPAKNQVSGPVNPMSATKNTGMDSNPARNAKPYRLKDNGDFPPLSS